MRPINPAWFLGRRPALLALAVLLLLIPISGTARADPPATLPRPLGESGLRAGAVAAPPGLAVDVFGQYRLTPVPGAGYMTWEGILVNTGREAMVFQTPLLDGEALTTNTPNVAWWQFYPSETVEPGRARLLRINFIQTPVRPRTLTLIAGGKKETAIPPYQAPLNRIAALTWSLDGRRLFVKLARRNAGVRRVWVNGTEIRDFSRLPSAEEGLEVLALDLRAAPAVGEPVHVRVDLKDGRDCHGYVRAWRGILRDAYLANTPETRKHYELDDPPGVAGLTGAWYGDVACYDARMGGPGKAAWETIADRRKLFLEKPGQLSYIHYCTAAYPAMWNLYGGIADAAMSSPYGLSHGKDVSRFLDDEEHALTATRRATEPAPFFWIADCFKRKARYIEPEELNSLVWTSLLLGGKGISYFACDFTTNGFSMNPVLGEAIRKLNGELWARRDILSPLIPMSEERVGQPLTGHKIYTAWAGDMGALVLLRNLDYRTDDQANDRQARFQVNAKTNIELSLSLPSWLTCEAARDFLSTNELPGRLEGQTLRLTVARLDGFRLLWLEQGAKARLAPPAVTPVKPAAVAPRGFWRRFWDWLKSVWDWCFG